MHTLTQNQQYKATLSLTGLEVFANNQMIENKLTEAGFTNVLVIGSGKNRTATGTWNKPTETNVQLPKQVVTINQ